ncbi:MAG: hypothetical protein EDM05_55995 (plasmid) [Leptolyngbya sp. IPPAS B-1204]
MPTLPSAGKDIVPSQQRNLDRGTLGGAPLLQEHYGVVPYACRPEHSAIFQCSSVPAGGLRRILLTASEERFEIQAGRKLATVTVKHALKHPN